MKVSSRLETRKNITNHAEIQRLMLESRRKLLLAERANAFFTSQRDGKLPTAAWKFPS